MRSKVAVKNLTTLAYVATLPCETLMSENNKFPTRYIFKAWWSCLYQIKKGLLRSLLVGQKLKSVNII